MINDFGFDEELVADIEERLSQLVAEVADVGDKDAEGAIESTFDLLYEAANDVLAISKGQKQPFGPRSASDEWKLVD